MGRMMEAKAHKRGAELLSIRVELYGRARLLCGRRDTRIEVPTPARVEEVAAALASACPELVGQVVRSDRTRLEESYILNLNGKQFVDGQELNLEEDDALLLFSSQAGG